MTRPGPPLYSRLVKELHGPRKYPRPLFVLLHRGQDRARTERPLPCGKRTLQPFQLLDGGAQLLQDRRIAFRQPCRRQNADAFPASGKDRPIRPTEVEHGQRSRAHKRGPCILAQKVSRHSILLSKRFARTRRSSWSAVTCPRKPPQTGRFAAGIPRRGPDGNRPELSSSPHSVDQKNAHPLSSL